MTLAAGAARAPLAPLTLRLAAFAIDYLVLAAYVALVAVAGFLVGPEVGLERAFADPLRAQLSGLLALTLPVVAYFAGFEGSSRQATPGKQVLGLRVVDQDRGRLPWLRSFLRSGLKFAPWELAHTCLWRLPGWPGPVESVPPGVIVGLAAVWLLVGLYLVMPLVDRNNRTPYDHLAASRVVRPGGARRARTGREAASTG